MKRTFVAACTAAAFGFTALTGCGFGNNKDDAATSSSVRDGHTVCAQDFGGTTISTVPDDDAATDSTELPDVICQTADGQLILLDGNDGERESNEKSYYYYDALGFLWFFHDGHVKKHGTKKYTVPP